MAIKDGLNFNHSIPINIVHLKSPISLPRPTLPFLYPSHIHDMLILDPLKKKMKRSREGGRVENKSNLIFYKESPLKAKNLIKLAKYLGQRFIGYKAQSVYIYIYFKINKATHDPLLSRQWLVTSKQTMVNQILIKKQVLIKPKNMDLQLRP
jgi:hypothetical protein